MIPAGVSSKLDGLTLFLTPLLPAPRSEAIRFSRAALASQQPVLAAPYPGAKAFG